MLLLSLTWFLNSSCSIFFFCKSIVLSCWKPSMFPSHGLPLLLHSIGKTGRLSPLTV